MRSPDRPPSRATRLRTGSAAGTALLVVACGILSAPRSAFTQAQAPQAKAKAAGVFDEETSKEEAKPADPTRAAAATDRDTIGFTQQNVAAQMTELEERMFRLSEALRSLEPENASRLRLALKFSREELILTQMKETQKLMKEAQLSKAETEVRELLAKLEHLRNLLLAEDLDFQMKLARLRQMRESLGQLERIIKEEKRELTWSRRAEEQQAELARLKQKRTELEALVRDQKSVLGDTQEAIPRAGGVAPQEKREALRTRETAVRKKTAALAADPSFANLQPAHLKEAETQLGDAETQLGTTDSRAAVAAEERALASLRKELDRLVDRIGKEEQAVALAEFRRFEHDQARNRGAADSLGIASARLGDSGVALQKDLIRAGGAMQAAEGELDKTAAKPAAVDQNEALKHLTKSRDDLGKGIESLLVELRSELQTRILAELTEMHEIQATIRETTEAQAPRVAQKSRTALVLLTSMSQKEAELADRTDHLRALTEETEFGIALPTALRVVGREMTRAQEWLKEGDASARTVTLEKRIEEDLLALLEAMRRLPPSTPPPPGPLPTEMRALERELNRLIAELKMIRLLQSRLNDDTTGVDKGRPEPAILPPALRREIEALKSAQEEIRDSLAKISSRLPSFDGSGAEAEPGQVDK